MRLSVKLHAITLLLLTHVTHTKNSFYLNETKRGDPRVLADVIFGAEEPQVFDVRHGVSSLYATKTHTATEKSRDIVIGVAFISKVRKSLTYTRTMQLIHVQVMTYAMAITRVIDSTSIIILINQILF